MRWVFPDDVLRVAAVFVLPVVKKCTHALFHQMNRSGWSMGAVSQ
ncbi:MAG: hypothetical protein ACI8W7_003559 [Gammaproteobacteria bacterium]|jgi:hypothetical protein